MDLIETIGNDAADDLSNWTTANRALENGNFSNYGYRDHNNGLLNVKANLDIAPATVELPSFGPRLVLVETPNLNPWSANYFTVVDPTDSDHLILRFVEPFNPDLDDISIRTIRGTKNGNSWALNAVNDNITLLDAVSGTQIPGVTANGQNTLYIAVTGLGSTANRDNYAYSIEISIDQNDNEIPDYLDIENDPLLDQNSNGQIDAYEDCNHNGIPDPNDDGDENGDGFPDECISITFVIDESESMIEELDGVKAAMQNLVSDWDGAAHTYHLISFNESVQHRLSTTDVSAIQSAIAAIQPNGGASCGEYSVTALQQALSLGMPEQYHIIFATDEAACEPPEEFVSVQDGILENGYVLHSLNSPGVPTRGSHGDTVIAGTRDQRDFYYDFGGLARVSGGYGLDLTYEGWYHENALTMIGRSIAISTSLAVRSGTNTGEYDSYTIPIDASINEITATLFVDEPLGFNLYKPGGVQVIPNEWIISETGQILFQYRASTQGLDGNWTLQVKESEGQVTDFELEVRGDGQSGVRQTTLSEETECCSPVTLPVKVEGSYNPSFVIVDEEGSYVSTPSVSNLGDQLYNLTFTPSTAGIYRVQTNEATVRRETIIDVEVGPESLPEPPDNVTALAVSHDRIEIAWEHISTNINRIVILRGQPANYVEIASFTDGNLLDITSYSDSGLTPETEYCYRVRVENNLGSAGASPVCATTFGVPIAPSDLTAASPSNTQVQLTWYDNSINETGFKIQRQTGSGSFVTIKTLPGQSGIGSISSTIGGLTPETEYCYQVKAYNLVGESGPSNIICSSTGPLVSGGPSDLIAALNDPQVDLSWSSNVPNVDSFLIDRRFDGHMGTFKQIDKTGAFQTSYVDQYNIDPGESYCYRVKALLTDGNLTEYSPEACTDDSTTSDSPSGLITTAQIVTKDFWSNRVFSKAMDTVVLPAPDKPVSQTIVPFCWYRASR